MRWFAIFALIFCAGFAVSGTAERLILYPLDPNEVSPNDAGVPAMTTYQITTDDNETLIVWAAEPRPGQPVVLYFQGNAGNLAVRAARFRSFLRAGFGVVAPGYRGSSGSSGTAHQAALESDAELVRDNLPGFVSVDTNVIYYGESLGGAVATHLATLVEPTALVLEASFTSIPDLARYHAPYAPHIALAISDTWPTKRRIQRTNAPLLILHGSVDELIPISMGRTLLRRSGATDKKLVVARGAGHTDVWQPAVKKVLFEFLSGF